jgi:restriction system protein
LFDGQRRCVQVVRALQVQIIVTKMRSDPAMLENKHFIVRTPLFPLYSKVRLLVQILDGVAKDSVWGMIKALFDQTGTPQNSVDWSQPGDWIEQRLHGINRDLAKKIWSESSEAVNPRHIYGSYLFINTFGLLVPDAQGVYRSSVDGIGFVENNPMVLRKLDEEEGLPQLLSILAAHSPAKRGDLLDEWSEFLLENSNYGTASTFKDTLSRRLLNLVERGYVAREGNTYTITDKGVSYAAPVGPEKVQRPYIAVLGAIKNYNDTQTKELRERLENMNPYRFEMLIKDLLEAMDYEDVVVTKQSGDKGVDVVASFQFGITQIKEVVQVKRHKGNITRPVLDQLRGALPYHGAIRGTIITTGGFAQGCKDAALFPGAAPITLIDGDKVIELLLKHGVGVKKKPQTLIEIDESYFASDDPETQIPEEQ